MPNKWHGIEIPRGSLITSYRKLSEQTGIAQTTLVRCTKKLVDSEVITTEKVKAEREFTLISILKYDTYQAKKEDSGTQTELERNSKGTQTELERNSKGTQTELLLEYKNNRKEDSKNLEYKKLNTHTEIFKNFQNVCKDNTLAERLTGEFIAYNAEKNQEWWDNGLWKNHVQGFYRRDLKLKGQKTQSPQIAPVPPTEQKQAPQAPDPEAVKVWENVKKRLSELMNAKAIKVWINPITAFAVNGKNLTIKVPNQFFGEYLVKNYSQQLETALTEEKIESLTYKINA
jgi:DNA-binding Lrp family transcriptional regulator